ncbi:hypothetical protein MYSTI_05525 [Myxococcus stipitatus DSM 14675]|uniref:Uncharacterized protein n=1 Tax=Myxococcus stipitatus (strain DSM 14675 / JCM 12634 / Mx s8) TaxID=1278073 RepID=L7UGX4_MYXSD|nr:hypothetical protein [Myxococcus stipitatus]AGC46802.1 hypothetical protein MYSTI_05525 [Myxococcus stipitatus DSM 14675]
MLWSLLSLGVLLSAKPPSDEKVFVPCPLSTPEWAEARERFRALDARVEALPDEDDARSTVVALGEVLKSRCFEMSREETSSPVSEEEPPPALSLKAWWRQGGRAWVESYLELGKPEVRTVVLPPEVRPALARETAAPDHRLASLLCSAADRECAKQMVSWEVKAEASFARERDRVAKTTDLDEKIAARCVAEARAKPARWRYTSWRSCQRDSISHGTQPPVIRMRMPTDGWLVMRGRRGHHSFCDEVRAYHLGTGTAWVSQSCSELALYEDDARLGQVDVQATDAARSARVAVGTVSLDLLREMARAVLLADEPMAHGRASAISVPVPKGYRIEWRERKSGLSSVGMGGGAGWFTSGQTRLTWTWFPPERAEPLAGELTWPDSSQPMEDLADRLVVEAEETFKQGCPARLAPAALLDFTQPPGVNRLDAPTGVARPQDALLTALRTWQPPPGCSVPKE